MWQVEKRPTVPQRHEQHMHINELIARLRKEYEAMPSENVKEMIRLAELVKEFQGRDEDRWRAQEDLEAFMNIHELPHAVSSWLTDYRDKELE